MNKDKRTGWLAKLKVGDKVVISQGGWSKNFAIRVVTKITPTGMMVIDGTLFNPGGDERGNRNYRSHLLEATEKLLTRIEQTDERKRFRFKLLCISDGVNRLSDSDLDDLREIDGIMEVFNKIEEIKKRTKL